MEHRRKSESARTKNKYQIDALTSVDEYDNSKSVGLFSHSATVS